MHQFVTRGGAKELWDLTDKEILIHGPSGTGKSRACLEKLVYAALDHPGLRGLIVRKTAKSLTTSAIAIMKRDVLPELILGRQVKFHNGNREDPPRYEFANGSTIVVDGMDDPRKILSSSFDMIYVMNATDLDLDDWEDLLSVLQGDTMGYTQIIACSRPQTDVHWLWLRVLSGKTTAIESRHEDNPRLFARVSGELKITPYGTEYLGRLNDLSGVRRLRNALGLWAAAEGMIFEKFDSAVHMVRSFEPPVDWGRLWHIDFGYKAPFSWGNWVREPDGRLLLHQEIYYTRRTIDDHAETILRVTYGQPRPEKIVCDHDAADRETLERILNKAWFGIENPDDPRWVRTVTAKKAVKQGIDAVNKRLKRHDIAFMHGALIERDPELVAMQLPTCGVEELPGYIWADGAQDHPLKRNDHFCDGMRYVVMAEDSVQTIGVRMRKAS